MSEAITIHAPMQATLVELLVNAGEPVAPGQALAVLEVMKMQHLVEAPQAGVVESIGVATGVLLEAQQVLMTLRREVQGGAARSESVETPIDQPAASTPPHDARQPAAESTALAELNAARAKTLDTARPEAVAKRHASGRRTARENIAALIDADSFVEYGQLVFAAQRSRRSLDDLKTNTPADGLVCGLARINGAQHPGASDCVVLHYDYSVLAGTQGAMNHAKTDRLLDIAAKSRKPVIFFTEGGGGRPGDVDVQTLGGLHIGSFAAMARLSGSVPLIGIANGYCFAGNAAFLGCCDVVIATRAAAIGMGGPAMIEGGGLGRYAPAEIGPAESQAATGVVDVLVDDDAQAVEVAKQYLGYFQGMRADWQAPDAERLRTLIPDNRLQVYDMRRVLHGIADIDSVLMLRDGFGAGMITALARIAGRPVGVIANNPSHLAGAIDHSAADKAARFMQLCDAHGLPIVSLCDTPGIMVGPDSEETANVRHASRLFVTGANLSVPLVTIVIRKAYGLGAMAMAGGGFHETLATVAWPSGEFGAMGLEGAVRLGFRKELEAIDDPAEREAAFAQRVADAYERGKALNAAPYFEFDAVIDPAETRGWLIATLSGIPVTPGTRPNIDTW